MRLFQSLALLTWFLALCAPARAATLTITTTGSATGAVSAIGGGLNTVCNPNPNGTCNPFTFPDGTVVRVTANTPSTPGVLSGTGSASACGTSVCSFTISGNVSITGTFNSGPSVSITITLAGDGTGNVGADNDQCQNFELGFSACTLNYAPGSSATLVGYSMAGNIFTAFSAGTADASSCTTSPCTFTLNSNSTVTASFSRLTTVAVQPAGTTITAGQMKSFTDVGTFSNSQTRSLVGEAGSGTGTWSTKRSLPQATFDAGAAGLNTNVYVVGGGINGSPSAIVEMYNPAVAPLGITDSWTAVQSLHTVREGHGVAAVGGRLYAISGSTTNNVLINSVEVYNPSNNTWATTPASIPTARAHFATAVVGNVIYALGGGTVGSPLHTVEAYDTTTNTWSAKADMPTARTFFAAAAVGGTIYAFGDSTGAVEAYDTTTNTWSSRAPMPTPRTTLAAGAIDGLVYAVGGQSGTTMTGIVDVYNPTTNTWTSLGSMPTARGAMNELAVLDGRLWVPGGCTTTTGNCPNVTSTFEAFRPPETTWWSSNTSVATISPNGSATGQNPGTSTIIARAVGFDCAATQTCVTLAVVSQVAFTDDPLTAQASVIRAVHVAELRYRIDALRQKYGLSAFSWTDASLPPGLAVRAVHVSEMRTALQQAYTAASKSLPTFTDSTLVAGGTLIKVVHIKELRDAVITLENS